MRRGQLSDAETLAAYERGGASIVAIAVAEGLSAYGVISRLGRERKRRRERGRAVLHRRRVARLEADTWEALQEQVERLRESVARL